MAQAPISTAIPFGNVPVTASAAAIKPLSPNEIRILTWAISWKFQTFRLELAHQGALFHFLLHVPKADDSKDEEGGPLPASFIRSFWNAVAPAFGPAPKETWIVWYRRGASGEDGCQATLTPDSTQMEQRLLELVQHHLPLLISETKQQRDGTIQGSHIWLAVRDNSQAPDDPLIELVGDHFREIVSIWLKPLPPDQYPEIPRVDLSSIEAYISSPHKAVRLVDVRVSPGSELQRAVFKTAGVTAPSSVFEEVHAISDQITQADMQAELHNLVRVQTHPNVIPAPLAIVTIQTSERKDEGPLLVGWLQRKYLAWEAQDIPGVQQRSVEAARWRLRYANDLVQGVSYLIKERGYYHSDIAAHNTVLTDGPPKGRLLLMDFEPFELYVNTDGPQAPEAEGRWEAEMDRTGVLRYTSTGQIVEDREQTIKADWKNLPEALERLTMFNVGTTLARILDCRVEFPWHDQSAIEDTTGLFISKLRSEQEDPARDAWEALISSEVRAITRRCCSYDPQKRPLAEELAGIMSKLVEKLWSSVSSPTL